MSIKVINKEIQINTKGTNDLIDITEEIRKHVSDSGFSRGTVTVFVVGSTAGITTFEFEPGLTHDIREFYEKIIPQKQHYCHDDTWGDANGFSHLRASLMGPSIVIPFEEKKLFLGTWQQVVLAEFDNRSRKRKVIVSIAGE